MHTQWPLPRERSYFFLILFLAFAKSLSLRAMNQHSIHSTGYKQLERKGDAGERDGWMDGWKITRPCIDLRS